MILNGFDNKSIIIELKLNKNSTTDVLLCSHRRRLNKPTQKQIKTLENRKKRNK